MIEVNCAKCGSIFERRGAKRGTMPHCLKCKTEAEAQRIKKHTEKRRLDNSVKQGRGASVHTVSSGALAY